jgi:two-component system nitrogen regulation response regulator GlnG
VPIFPPETWSALLAYSWPGNIRELQNVLKQAILQNPGPVIQPQDLPPGLRQGSGSSLGSGSFASLAGLTPVDAATLFDWDQFVAERVAASSESIYADALLTMEREILSRVLQHTRGNKLQAAKLLGIARNSLRTKLRTLGLEQEGTEDDQST